MRRLSPMQENVLWVVARNEPATAADVAYHLNVFPEDVRSPLRSLEGRGLLGRQYTGHYRSNGRVAFVVTQEGVAVADTMDSEFSE